MYNQNIGDIFGYGKYPNNMSKVSHDPALPITNETVGIELEVEGLSEEMAAYRAAVRGDNPPKSLSLWNLTTDGSLRGAAMEFVSKPVSGDNIQRAVEQLSDYMNNKRHSYGHRCSLHVHVNACDMTISQYLNLIYLYIIFEEVLFNYLGTDRRANFYCLPYMDSDQAMNRIHRAIGRLYNPKNKLRVPVADQFNHFINSCNKYTALNFRSTGNFGTVEFRGHRGTHNRREIMNWIHIILHMKRYAMHNVMNWTELPQTISDFGVEVFPQRVFEQSWHLLRRHSSPDSILGGIRRAQDLMQEATRQEVQKSIISDCRKLLRKQIAVNPGFANYAKTHEIKSSTLLSYLHSALPKDDNGEAKGLEEAYKVYMEACGKKSEGINPYNLRSLSGNLSGDTLLEDERPEPEFDVPRPRGTVRVTNVGRWAVGNEQVFGTGPGAYNGIPYSEIANMPEAVVNRELWQRSANEALEGYPERYSTRVELHLPEPTWKINLYSSLSSIQTLIRIRWFWTHWAGDNPHILTASTELRQRLATRLRQTDDSITREMNVIDEHWPMWEQHMAGM